MRFLPPPHEPDEKRRGALAPRALGLAIGLLLGYLLVLFPWSASEPAAPTTLASRH